MQPLERQGFTAQQIKDVLHAKNKSRNVRFRYDLLDKDLNYKCTLKNVLEGEVDYSAFSTIKRTAKFKIKEDYISSHVGRGTREANFSYGVGGTISFSTWSNTGTSVVNNEIVLVGNGTGLANSRFELFTGSDSTGWLANGWLTWGNQWSYRVEGVTGTYAQEQTRQGSTTYSCGIQSDSKPVIASGGQKIYFSVFYRLFNNEVIPNYCYAMSDAGNIPFTITSNVNIQNNNWYRLEGECTVPAGRASASYGLLLGTNSNIPGGIVNWDNAYLSLTKAVYTGVATSPVIDISNTTTQGLRNATIANTILNYKMTKPTYNPVSNSNSPYCQVESRVSLDGGTTWSQYKAIGDWGNIPDLPAGSNATNVKLQLRWQVNRYQASDEPKLSSVSIKITYEEDVIVPETDVINYLSDRIQPFMEIEMPNKEWVSFPLGVFLLNSPSRRDGIDGVYRDIEAYDQLVVLRDDKFATNENKWVWTCTQQVEQFLQEAGVYKYSITPSNIKINYNFPAGMSILDAINQILQSINYTPLWVDANGVFRATPYLNPTDRPVEYEYLDDDLSVIYNGLDEEYDIFETANVWVVQQANVEGAPLRSMLANNDPKSPTSTASLGRSVVDFREVDNIADQATLDAYVQRIAQESTMTYGKLKFKTALMPFHENQDVLRVRYDKLDIDSSFAETGWKMQLKVGGEMEHEVRKVVKV